MIPEGRSIRSICVVGAGIVGLSAALAFSRALPDVRVRLIATPPDPFMAAFSFLPALPRSEAVAALRKMLPLQVRVAQPLPAEVLPPHPHLRGEWGLAGA